MKKANVKEIKEKKAKIKVPTDKKKVALIIVTTLIPPIGSIAMAIDYHKERKELRDRIEVENRVRETLEKAKKESEEKAQAVDVENNEEINAKEES